jgi:anthranilate synthase/aminodeoxychorismate synthase-like glutamine amidotransferase
MSMRGSKLRARAPYRDHHADRIPRALTRVLLLDNRDSFVWNLAQALANLGALVEVLRSDRVRVADLEARAWAALVISPGPGRPEDAGISMAAIETFLGRVPILGVCLGHQAIGVAFGGRVERAPPCHGKAWAIHHAGEGLFAGIESPTPAARYHSLAVLRSPWPESLIADAWTAEGDVMAVRHRRAPVFGLQFHPESFLTRDGTRLLANFLALAA